MSPLPAAFDPAGLMPNVRDYLIAQGVVRNPRVSGALPPLWLDPKKGIPYPGQTEGVQPVESHPDLVLGAYPETGIASQPFEGFYVQRAITIFIRGRTSPLVQSKHEDLRAALHDKRNLVMGVLQVNQCMMVRELQRIGADANGYVYNSEYMFDLWGPD